MNNEPDFTEDNSDFIVNNPNCKHLKEPVSLASGLYIVATPIGNLGDITLRALDILQNVDVVMCEDTRVTNKLLAKYGIKAKMFAYNDYNADKIRPKVLDLLYNSQSVALVSDAGTPLISDPGYKLVSEVHKAGFYVTTLPGASSVLAALTLAGLPTNRFLFEGFLPPKQQARIRALQDLANINTTIVLLERASRVVGLLPELLETLGNREIAITREITKSYEQVIKGTISELEEYYQQNDAPRGEVVIVIGTPIASIINEDDIDTMLVSMMSEMKMKDAVAVVAEQCGLPKKQIYSRALELQKGK